MSLLLGVALTITIGLMTMHARHARGLPVPQWVPGPFRLSVVPLNAGDRRRTGVAHCALRFGPWAAGSRRLLLITPLLVLSRDVGVSSYLPRIKLRTRLEPKGPAPGLSLYDRGALRRGFAWVQSNQIAHVRGSLVHSVEKR